MRFGFWVGNGHEIDETLRVAKRAESKGWDGLWYADHFMPSMADTTGPIHEVWAVLAAWAVVTEKARLGTLVCGNTYRNPAILAKQAVTVDHISAGRVVLGLGAGWQQNEHGAYGIEFGTFTDRFEKLEEALQIILSLRDADRTDLEGQHYQMVDAPLDPKPVGPLPVLIGGGGERKTLRMVAEYADEWNVWATPEIMAHKSVVLDQHCEDVGRDPGEIQRSAVALLFLCQTEAEAQEVRDRNIERPTLIGTAAQLREELVAYVEAGVNEVIIPDFTLGTGSEQEEKLDQFLQEVAGPFRP